MEFIFDKDAVKEVKETSDGVIVRSHHGDILLRWEVIDEIAEASEKHYFNQAVKTVEIMSGQKKIN